MGEYIQHLHHGSIKLGTCENLYYATFQNYITDLKNGLFKAERGNDDPDGYIRPDTYRFRFPFPDEDQLKLGDYPEFDRGVVFRLPYSLAVEIGHEENTTFEVKGRPGASDWRIKAPCPEIGGKNFRGDKHIEIVQQKLVKVEGVGLELRTIGRCPYCGTRNQLDHVELLALDIWVNDVGSHNYTPLQREIVKRALLGYEMKSIKELI